MRLKIFILLLFAIWGAERSSAQIGANYTQPRILILLDKSSSMINLWDGGRQKSKVANEVILRLMDSVYMVNKDVEFSLRVFGHQYTVDENNCRDTRNEVPFRKDNRLQMEYRLDDIQPLGVTSIAYALQQAADNDLVDVSQNAYSIILITDGGESCGGDICEVMRKLSESKVFFRPYIVNLETAPQLKTAYACMGDYLEVTKNNDIPAAVTKIVNAFRPVIGISNTEYTKVKEIAAKTPTVLNVKIPDIKIRDTIKATLTGGTIAAIPVPIPGLKIGAPKSPKPQATTVPAFMASAAAEEEPASLPVFTIGRVTPEGLRQIDIATAGTTRPRAVTPPVFVPTIAEEEAVRPAPETITRLAASPYRQVSIVPVAARMNPVANLPAFVPMVADEIPERPAPEKIAQLPVTPPKRIMTIILLDADGSMFRQRKLPPMPPLRFDAVAAVTPAKNVATGPKISVGTPVDYKVETEDAAETTVEVYFTNGKGKFYATTPQIMLIDPVSGTLSRRFYRTVDANGNPDAQTNIPPGKYHLTFSETRSLYVNNVTVEANKRNKIIVTVNKASLSFEYANNISRPITEFSAIVKELFIENGKLTTQKCNEKLVYEPGNYHVIINTFPQDVRNIDLDFNEKIIKILQPGFAKFVAEEGMASVTLYQRLGDKFLSFHTLSLKDPAASHLRIQPGEYQAHYHKGPGGQHASEKVVTFIVKATEETEVILN